MRILKILLAVVIGLVALAAGVFVAAAIAVMALVFLGIRWARRRLRRPADRRPVAAPTAGREVIDVSATEVAEGTEKTQRLTG